MNERIQELADKAAADFPGIPDQFCEKFAELIVKEIIQSIEKTIETNCDTDSEKTIVKRWIVNLLLQICWNISE